MRSDDYIEGTILTDLSFKPLAVDQGAAALLSEGVGATKRASDPPEEESGLRDELLQRLRRLRSDELPSAHIHFSIGTASYSCRVSVLRSCLEPSEPYGLALYVQRGADATEAMRSIAADYDLTEREYEALLHVSMGLSCKEMAERMKISPNTVKAFLRLIMIKMGVERRAGIISKVLEYTQNGNGKPQSTPEERAKARSTSG